MGSNLVARLSLMDTRAPKFEPISIFFFGGVKFHISKIHTQNVGMDSNLGTRLPLMGKRTPKFEPISTFRVADFQSKIRICGFLDQIFDHF